MTRVTAHTLGGGRYVVTGGSGFLGSSVALALCEAGHSALVVDARPPLVSHALLSWVRGSVVDGDALAAAFAGALGVVHLAGRATFTRAEGYRQLRELHVGGAVSVVEAASRAGVPRVVFGSTAMAYATSTTRRRLREDEPCEVGTLDAWPYCLTMREAEEAARDRCGALGVRFVSLRPALVLGPAGGSMAGAGHALLTRWAELPDSALTGSLSVADVRDLRPAYVAALTSTDAAGAYNLGGHDADIVSLVRASVAPRSPGVRAAAARLGARALRGLGVGVDPVVRELARMHTLIDSARAVNDLRYAPRPLADTLRAMAADSTMRAVVADRMAAP